ncbi:uncharacterized protein Z520_00351 [Fonsecaea multimorphosa CBS 102226]|uniref:NAD-dependent epimerase/dehydratase domain-containing protein n=1 Tax=Fonsecaea multimorphosa CBS 102226 TaxID=1442371 RepID=A0A0D2KJJ4_9EURO|nr:uncharacterized protein Z520_00351 [Fonsecaea multimorphosa CBS 102226]KIY03660.1 hypothetical protein Z520_00351 [Fonsecaea multimorphosa CBS 102226]OAL32359.1 hypothetical protein AYO22_00381 [Fonsecaea multimorphosa]
MATEKKVFLIGPGLIGTDLLELLVEAGYEVTTMVRREAHAAQVKDLGAREVVMGSLDDKDIIRKYTAASPIVIHTATADHLPSVEAVLEGVRQRAEQGLETVFLHTSGTSELVDNSKGMYKSDKVYSDERPEEVDQVPDTAPHREIDLAILAARRDLGTKAKISIVLPCLVYGIGKCSGRVSMQLPTMVRFALKHGWAPVIGKGLSVRSNIHVQDLVRGYMVILDWMQRSSADEVLKNPYFFCSTGEDMAWGDAAAEIGRLLHAAGRIKDPTPRPVPPELYGDLFGVYSPTTVGANSRSRADRLRKMGWSPREKGVLESLREDEVPILLKETGEWNGYTGLASSGTHVLKSLE